MDGTDGAQCEAQAILSSLTFSQRDRRIVPYGSPRICVMQEKPIERLVLLQARLPFVPVFVRLGFRVIPALGSFSREFKP
jgi:hypothetical protein